MRIYFFCVLAYVSFAVCYVPDASMNYMKSWGNTAITAYEYGHKQWDPQHKPWNRFNPVKILSTDEPEKGAGDVDGWDSVPKGVTPESVIDKKLEKAKVEYDAKLESEQEAAANKPKPDWAQAADDQLAEESAKESKANSQTREVEQEIPNQKSGDLYDGGPAEPSRVSVDDEPAFIEDYDSEAPGALSPMARKLIWDVDHERPLRIPLEKIPKGVKDEIALEFTRRSAAEQAGGMTNEKYNPETIHRPLNNGSVKGSDEWEMSDVN